jgi:hypothetical protein
MTPNGSSGHASFSHARRFNWQPPKQESLVAACRAFLPATRSAALRRLEGRDVHHELVISAPLVQIVHICLHPNEIEKRDSSRLTGKEAFLPHMSPLTPELAMFNHGYTTHSCNFLDRAYCTVQYRKNFSDYRRDTSLLGERRRELSFLLHGVNSHFSCLSMPG